MASFRLFTLIAALFCYTCFSGSESVGTYWQGTLKNAVNLHDFSNPYIESLSPKAHQYAAEPLLEALQRMATWVNERWGKKLQVGDLSKRDGGKLARHETHQLGLDADIAYLSLNPKTDGHRSKAEHNKFRETFIVNGKISAEFDAEKNYELIRHAIQTYPVDRVFVACKVKEELLKVAERFPLERDALFAKITAYPHHNDHFHVRLLCPDTNFKCKSDLKVWKDIGCKT